MDDSHDVHNTVNLARLPAAMARRGMTMSAVIQDIGDPAHRTAAKERFQRIHRTLRDRICLLDYEPGSHLGEEELAREFGTSRTPVRRVLGRLEAEGLIERRHGVGTIVTQFDLESLAQVYRLRVELASLMGRLAPFNCGDRGLALLRSHVARTEDLTRHPVPTAFARLNMDFNTDLFSMIGNAPLREITERLYFQTTRIWIKSVPELNFSEELAHLERQMCDVIEALKVGDHGAVGDICRVHISMSFVRMQRHEETARSQ